MLAWFEPQGHSFHPIVWLPEQTPVSLCPERLLEPLDVGPEDWVSTPLMGADLELRLFV